MPLCKKCDLELPPDAFTGTQLKRVKGGRTTPILCIDCNVADQQAIISGYDTSAEAVEKRAAKTVRRSEKNERMKTRIRLNPGACKVLIQLAEGVDIDESDWQPKERQSIWHQLQARGLVDGESLNELGWCFLAKMQKLEPWMTVKFPHDPWVQQWWPRLNKVDASWALDEQDLDVQESEGSQDMESEHASWALDEQGHCAQESEGGQNVESNTSLPRKRARRARWPDGSRKKMKKKTAAGNCMEVWQPQS